MAPDEGAQEKAEALARLAADRALALAERTSERAQKLAVERAVRDANVDRDLAEHQRRLQAINGSQQAMAASLRAVEKAIDQLSDTFEKQSAVNAALASHLRERESLGFSRKTLWVAALTALAAYIPLLVLLVANVH